jgi:hypothetical protein
MYLLASNGISIGHLTNDDVIRDSAVWDNDCVGLLDLSTHRKVEP